MSRVTGIFDTADGADHAITRLLSDGFAKEDISLILPKGAHTTYEMPPVSENTSAVAEGGFTGAAIGSAFGALLASLTTVGSLAITGGNIIMAGPIVAALSGAGAGGVIGGLGGVLIGAGYAIDEARRYEEYIKAGKTIVAVTVRDEIKEARARIALRNHGAATKVA
jgi:hypothetical protein